MVVADLTQNMAGQSELSVIFISLPRGQGAFQSSKGGDDDVLGGVGYQVNRNVGGQSLPLMRSQPLIKNNQISRFCTKKEKLGCLASTLSLIHI